MSYAPSEHSVFAEFGNRLADAAREQTLPRFRAGGDVRNKAGADYDPVTDADREGERAIAALIAESYPEHQIFGEEFGARGGDSDLRWVIDPVDGTRAFVCGVATWTTLIALQDRGAGVLGVIDQPFTDERWVGGSGQCQYRNGATTQLCETSGLKDLAAARISTTDPTDTAYFTTDEAAAFARLSAASRLVRFSMDAYAYGVLALGELDIVAENSLKEHDYAALIPVVEGAGGVITNWRGEPVGSDDRGEVLAAATPELHNAAMAVLNA